MQILSKLPALQALPSANRLGGPTDKPSRLALVSKHLQSLEAYNKGGKEDSEHVHSIFFFNLHFSNLQALIRREALTEWFSVGLLQMESISWKASSASLLEKVMQSEQVMYW